LKKSNKIIAAVLVGLLAIAIQFVRTVWFGGTATALLRTVIFSELWLAAIILWLRR